jgi:hypothetical protein
VRDVSPNPYDDVPEGLAKALEEYVLVIDDVELLDDPGRMDALGLLLEHLDAIHDQPRARSKWATSHKGRGFRVGVGDDGYFHEVGLGDHDGEVAEVPDHLVNSLITQILERPRQARYKVFAATRDLVWNWFDLALDGEKLLGHMLITHEGSSELMRASEEDVWSAHSKLHETARKGGAQDWQTLTSTHHR